MTEHVPGTSGAWYDPVLRTVLVIELSVSSREVLEARRWSSGERGEPVSFDELVGVDLSGFVRHAVVAGVRAMSADDEGSADADGA